MNTRVQIQGHIKRSCLTEFTNKMIRQRTDFNLNIFLIKESRQHEIPR